ncbi:cation acetate symporter [Streptomyces sp. NPDC001552]|uniref:sodium/solute symporter n=1 Tax=Streptomyces sp. NPDC001552 TaxID=3364587 RepID=UPI0036B698C2
MPVSVLAAAVPVASHTRGVLLVAFLVFLVVMLLLCLMVGPEKDQIDDYYVGGRRIGLLGNALALAGVCIPAGTVLGTTGTVALFGYDGIFISLSTLLSLGVLLLLVNPLRRRGRFTIGDVLAHRAAGPEVRIASGVVAIAVCLPLLMFELASVGVSVALLLGLTGSSAQQVITVMIGLLIISATVFGGMRCTSALQIIKNIVLFSACAVVAMLVMSKFSWSADLLLDSASRNSVRPAGYFSQGLSKQPDVSDAAADLDFVGLVLTIILGVASMPHVIMRINTLPALSSATTAVRHVINIVAAFVLTAIVIGLGSAALVGSRSIVSVDPGGTSALMLLAGSLAGGTSTTGGTWLFVLVACAVFATILATTASVTLAAAAAVAHDIYAQVLHGGAKEEVEVSAARWAAAGLGALGIVLAVSVQGWNIQFLTTLALSISASSVLPALVYSLFWNGYTRTGLLWTLYGGLGCSAGLQALSPAFTGRPDSLFPEWDMNWYPLQSVALVSVPVGFLLGWVTSRYGDPEKATRLRPTMPKLLNRQTGDSLGPASQVPETTRDHFHRPGPR